jgi:hypothetical protein
MIFLAALSLLSARVPAAAQTEDYRRGPQEAELAFVERASGLDGPIIPHFVPTDWNGTPVYLVDYDIEAGGEMVDAVLVIVRRPSGAWHRYYLTTGENFNGAAQLVAFGFANADPDAAKELIVLLRWPDGGGDICGQRYETRIFDTPRPGNPELRMLPISEHFGYGWNCDPHPYPYTTIAAIRAGLKRMGF